MTKTLYIAAAAFALLTFADPAHAANLVLNGNFTSGFIDWTIGGTGTGIEDSPAGCVICAPGAALGFGSTNGQDNTLTQSIPTIAGVTYDLTFTLTVGGSASGPLPDDFTASLNGSPCIL